MLAQSVGEKDESNSTAVVAKMICCLLMINEIVIFGNTEDASSATIEEIDSQCGWAAKVIFAG